MRKNLSITIAFLLVSVLGVVSAAGAQEDVADSVHFVIDVSGSMSGTPLVDAKDALTTAIGAQPASTALGLRSYAGGCGDGGVLRVPIGLDNRDALSNEISALAAGGGTPTDAALRAAVGDLPEAGNRTIVLISDGQSGCSDPCAVAEELVASEGVDFQVHTVGWNAGGGNAAELQCIADVTGGTYFETDDVDGLVDAIGSATNSCSDDVHLIGAKGSDQGDEFGGLGRQIGEFESAFRAYLEPKGITVTTYAVQYEAPGVKYIFTDIDRYLGASEVGATDLVNHAVAYADACPGSPIVVAGYSSGALVTRVALPSLPPVVTDQIASVQLFTDPAREPRTGFLPLGSANPASTGAMVWGAGATLPVNFALSAPTMSWCNEGDLVCDPSWKIQRLLVAGALGGLGNAKASSVLFAKVVLKDGGPLATHVDSYSDNGDLARAARSAAKPAERALTEDGS